ncbi:P-loop containing nucleoside triphosphate hydrolase protein [Lipomyces kononenkoae]|uniref:P-loop containing nucleoside triphosphate hydrolase protein n=1 Tax=Lipomyces kononenkoae TaxID=34357 RepID=A0ACC3SYS7_LIPKO
MQPHPSLSASTWPAFHGVVPASSTSAPPRVEYENPVRLPVGLAVSGAGVPLNKPLVTSPIENTSFPLNAVSLAGAQPSVSRDPHIVASPLEAPESCMPVPVGIPGVIPPQVWRAMPYIGAAEGQQLGLGPSYPANSHQSAFILSQLEVLRQLNAIYTRYPSESLRHSIMNFHAYLGTVLPPVPFPNTYRLGDRASIPPAQVTTQHTQFTQRQQNIPQVSMNATPSPNDSSYWPVILQTGTSPMHSSTDGSLSDISRISISNSSRATQIPPPMEEITQELFSNVTISPKLRQGSSGVSQPTTSNVERSGASTRNGSIDENELEWIPDIYAKKFIPVWFMNVNTFAAVRTESTPPPDFDLKIYVEGFAGQKLVSREVTPPFRYEFITAARQDLSVSTYNSKFSHFIDIEIKAQKKELRNYDLYGVSLEESDREKALFKLKCPGIREFTPAVSVGDLLLFRQLRPQYSAYESHAFTGYEYSGYVWHVDRAKGEVIVRLDGLVVESNIFNVQFVLDELFYWKCAMAVAKLQDEMQSDTSGFARKILFPECEDGITHESLPRGVFDLDWYDKDLNYEQQRAIDSILKRNYGNVPFLLSGPPGTGKTKTMVELALQLVKESPLCHILLCAPSDEAADTLALRLRHNLNNKKMFRLNRSTRAFDEVPTELLAFCAIEFVDSQDMFVIPEFKILMHYQIVVCSCRDANILNEAQCSNKSLATVERYMMEAFGHSQRTLHWTALLIDEAGQATEPETLIPLRVVMTDRSYVDDSPIVVMAGDHRQLGARTVSRNDKASELDVSLFERLMERPFYAEHPLSRKRQFRSGSKARGPYVRPAFSNLVRNYRSHPALLAVPSSLFYYDTLLPEATKINGLCAWERLPNHKMPMLFIENKGPDEMVEEGVSWFNVDEINLCFAVVKDLVDRNSVTPLEIAIAVPFREQIRRIRRKLRQQRLRDVNVGPIESYQGAEHRVVIVCTTRTRDRFIESDCQKGLGLVHEAKRFNVAITRAKELLVLIGNSDILQRDSNWRALLSFCYRNSLFDKLQPSQWMPNEEDVNAPLYYSRIERGIVYKSQMANSGVLTGEVIDDPMWLAGFTSEEAYLDA